MCTFSMIVDQLGPVIPDIQVNPAWIPGWTHEQIEEWRKFFEEAKAKLAAAKVEDAAAGTPDCTDPAKAPILERLAEMERRLTAIEKAVGVKG